MKTLYLKMIIILFQLFLLLFQIITRGDWGATIGIWMLLIISFLISDEDNQ